MKREIKFRGLRIDGRGWCYGDYSKSLEFYGVFIQFDRKGKDCMEEVIPESVGQFTGLKDKNGVEIYEGDLLNVPETHENIGGTHEVYYFEDGWVTSWEINGDKENAIKHSLGWRVNRGAYVIGNIHEKEGVQ